MAMEIAAPLRLGLAGADGRMGQVVRALIAERPDVALVAAVTREVSPDQALAACEVIIDFSSGPASAALAAKAAARRGPALVIGSTGFTAEDEAAIAKAADGIAIVKSGNFSLGVNLLAQLVEEASRRLGGDEWDIEILEAHHRRKADVPSGTALMLGEAAAAGRGQRLAEAAVRGRDGMTGPRPTGAIGFASLRGGGIVGEHSVILASDDEIITVAHSARDRRAFARGALAAALWVRDKPSGLYAMRDVLGPSPLRGERESSP
jgi:4-hydroxy-tetrahydrodipicolinate reductase